MLTMGMMAVGGGGGGGGSDGDGEYPLSVGYMLESSLSNPRQDRALCKPSMCVM